MQWVQALRECKSCAERRRIIREQLDRIKHRLGLKSDFEARQILQQEQNAERQARIAALRTQEKTHA